MIRSMTGFSSGFISNDKYDVMMEMKSVNSRFFEFRIKTSAFIDEWEHELKQKVHQRLKRGKIELYIKIVEKSAENKKIVVNEELALSYRQAFIRIAEVTGVPFEITMKDFIGLGHIIETERVNNDPQLKETLNQLLDTVLEDIDKMMLEEGRKTENDILQSLENIQTNVEEIEKSYPETLEKYKQNLENRLKESFENTQMNCEINENRILMEVEIVASRTAINEEIVRLKSHLSQFGKIISGRKGDSRKLDFIAQEMNREANTIASKSSDYEIVNRTIQMKSEIEKIREQIRNVV